MKKISIIYWSGTGNTETMAKAIQEGAKNGNADVKLVGVGEASLEDVSGADVVAFGCPAMGDEQLEENEMEPFIESILQDIKDKDIGLFGSYGWGSGDWMTNWEEQMKEYGANLVEESLIINEEPDDDGLEKCKKLGERLAEK
ncbi:flavodoxin [Clostridium ragsdalei P11]|uniref:Flavodoxin n=1 Tax=Clostridium ragsdalei P11 TaxID=1353534 RepID=A0A1A6AYI5_9CLOT|nr:flavodoxin [Clostridium ragsdalei]OBR95095.1 flavodoxin [Clostridium ragsdalei P11]